jgi:hypothetical protein
MTCTTGQSPDGSRFIACRRGERTPLLHRDPDTFVPLDSPWQIGGRVRHTKYGDGTITNRNSEAVRVEFDGGHTGTFMLAFVGKTMQVLP